MLSNEILTIYKNKGVNSCLNYATETGNFFLYNPNFVPKNPPVPIYPNVPPSAWRYPSSLGWYVVQPDSVTLEPEYFDLVLSCRETLDYWWSETFPEILEKGMIGFYYYYNSYSLRTVNFEKLNEFFEMIEDKLNLKEKTVIYKTDTNHAVILKIPDFWKETPLRRGFFSLFLRLGVVYYPYYKDLNEAITCYSLANSIKPAIELFLDGNTIMKGYLNRKGIVSTFGLIPKERIAAEFLTKSI